MRIQSFGQRHALRLEKGKENYRIWYWVPLFIRVLWFIFYILAIVLYYSFLFSTEQVSSKCIVPFYFSQGKALILCFCLKPLDTWISSTHSIIFSISIQYFSILTCAFLSADVIPHHKYIQLNSIGHTSLKIFIGLQYVAFFGTQLWLEKSAPKHVSSREKEKGNNLNNNKMSCICNFSKKKKKRGSCEEFYWVEDLVPQIKPIWMKPTFISGKIPFILIQESSGHMPLE